MAEFDRLGGALRDIAGDDAARAPREPDARVREALRALRPPTRSGASRIVGLALAATILSAIGVSLAFLARGGAPSDERRAASGEIVTDFLPLAYNGVPYTDAQIVRLEVPRAALRNFGLAPAELAAESATSSTVLADVLVGEDGLARAVRFVRTQRTEP